MSKWTPYTHRLSRFKFRYCEFPFWANMPPWNPLKYFPTWIFALSTFLSKSCYHIYSSVPRQGPCPYNWDCCLDFVLLIYTPLLFAIYFIFPNEAVIYRLGDLVWFRAKLSWTVKYTYINCIVVFKLQISKLQHCVFKKKLVWH